MPISNINSNSSNINITDFFQQCMDTVADLNLGDLFQKYKFESGMVAGAGLLGLTLFAVNKFRGSQNATQEKVEKSMSTIFGYEEMITKPKKLDTLDEILEELMYCILNHFKEVDGIFRVPGTENNIPVIMQIFKEKSVFKNEPEKSKKPKKTRKVEEAIPQIPILVDLARCEPHDVTSTFKRFLRERSIFNPIKEGLIGIEKLEVKIVQNVLRDLNEKDLTLAQKLFFFLAQIAASSEINRMSASNLAKPCIGPNLITIESENHLEVQSATGKIIDITQFLIENYDEIFTDLVSNHSAT